MLEENITVRCKAADKEVVLGLLSDCEDEFNMLILKETDKKLTCKLALDESIYLNDSDLS